MKPRRSEETQLVRQVIAYLRAHGIEAWRENTGGRRNDRGRYVPFGTPGRSDVGGCIPPGGRTLYIEVKRPGERPTRLQWDWLLRIQRAGGVAFWCHDLETVRAICPHLLEGRWIITDESHRFFITDEARTADAIRPPADAAEPRRRVRRGADRPPAPGRGHRAGRRG